MDLHAAVSVRRCGCVFTCWRINVREVGGRKLERYRLGVNLTETRSESENANYYKITLEVVK